MRPNPANDRRNIAPPYPTLRKGLALVAFAAFAAVTTWFIVRPAHRGPANPRVPVGMPKRFPDPSLLVPNSIRIRAATERHATAPNPEKPFAVFDELNLETEVCASFLVRHTEQGRPDAILCRRKGQIPAAFEVPINPSAGFSGRWYYRDLVVEYSVDGRPATRYLFVGSDRVEKRTLEGHFLEMGPVSRFKLFPTRGEKQQDSERDFH